ncbi:MAG: transposase [Candidatus Tyrphobacter sp.]
MQPATPRRSSSRTPDASSGSSTPPPRPGSALRPRSLFFWSRSYCVVSCGGAPLSVLKQYVEGQAGVESDDS